MSADDAGVVWLGHAGVALQVDGVRAVIDPLLTHRLGHLRRRGADPRDEDLRADVVLVSHAHADHLHRPSLRRVAARSPGAVVVVPTGASRYAAGLDLAGLDIGVVHADHARGRSRWSSPDREAVGYVVERAGKRAYHAGDTGLSDVMRSLGRIDLACVPISGCCGWSRADRPTGEVSGAGCSRASRHGRGTPERAPAGQGVTRRACAAAERSGPPTRARRRRPPGRRSPPASRRR